MLLYKAINRENQNNGYRNADTIDQHSRKIPLRNSRNHISSKNRSNFKKTKVSDQKPQTSWNKLYRTLEENTGATKKQVSRGRGFKSSFGRPENCMSLHANTVHCFLFPLNMFGFRFGFLMGNLGFPGVVCFLMRNMCGFLGFILFGVKHWLVFLELFCFEMNSIGFRWTTWFFLAGAHFYVLALCQPCCGRGC